MKKLYPLVTLLLGSLIYTSGVHAQTFTYTAVRNGSWHSTSGAGVWDPSGEPSANCNSCKIVIGAGVTVTLNAHVTLTGNSLLQVGTDGSAAAALLIPSSGGTDWNSSNNLILFNDGTNSVLKVVDGISIVNAANAGTYDGVLTAFITGGFTAYYKVLGNAPLGFIDQTISSSSPASYGKMVTGPVAVTASGVLPISLVDFEAVANNGAADLTWRTLQESNSDHFDIERSVDGGAKWEVVGKVAAKGNSSTPSDYSFTDANPGSGTFYYRVHGYDKDSRPFLSQVKAIRTTLIATIGVYPNPAKEYVNVSVPASETGALRIRLIGQSGQILVDKNLSSAAGTIQTFSVGNYPTGNYLIQVIAADGSKQTSKLVIARN